MWRESGRDMKWFTSSPEYLKTCMMNSAMNLCNWLVGFPRLIRVVLIFIFSIFFFSYLIEWVPRVDVFWEWRCSVLGNRDIHWKSHYDDGHWLLKVSVLCTLVITMPTDDPAPNGAGSSAGMVMTTFHIDGLVQERRNSIANALDLRLSCTDPCTCFLWGFRSHKCFLDVIKNGQWISQNVAALQVLSCRVK